MPKAGNHFMMSVLDAIGCDRAEELGQEPSGGISGLDCDVGLFSGLQKLSQPSQPSTVSLTVSFVTTAAINSKSFKQSHLNVKDRLNHINGWKQK